MLEYDCIFNFTNKIDEKNWKFEVDLNIELKREVLLTISTSRGEL